MHYRFNKQELCDFEQNIRREWVLTNGIGGYCGSSIIGAHNRTHQGYLIACLKPPVSRYLCFSKTNESFSQGMNSYDLTTAQHLDKDAPVKRKRTEGQKYLESFDYDGTICYTYKAGELTIRKHISLAQGTNLSAVAYEFENTGDEANFTITPLMNFREHSASSTSVLTPIPRRSAQRIAIRNKTIMQQIAKSLSKYMSYTGPRVMTYSSVSIGAEKSAPIAMPAARPPASIARMTGRITRT